MVFKIQVVWLISLLKPQQTPHYVIGGTLGNHSLWGTQLDFTGGLGNGFAYRFIYDKQEKDYWRNFGKVKILLTRHHFLGKMIKLKYFFLMNTKIFLNHLIVVQIF